MFTGIICTGLGFVLGKYYPEATSEVAKQCYQGAVNIAGKVTSSVTKK